MLEDLADVLRSYRAAESLTQQGLAARAGVSAATIRDIEQRRTVRPHPDSLHRLAKALGLAVPELRAFVRDAPAPGDGAPVEIGVLGALSLRQGRRAIEVGSGMQRIILARLALDPNVPVRRDELVDLLWRRDPPGRADELLSTYVSRIRAVVQPRRGRTGVVSSVAGVGYRLSADADLLDLIRFRELHRQACAAAVPQTALRLFEQAHGLWRGDPVADVEALRGHPLATALGEERLSSALLFARLADRAGEHARVLPLLRALAAGSPLHEPVHTQLMTALAAAGRRADALAVYAGIQRRLADELGIGPGPELTQAHVRVLREETSGGDAIAPAQLPADVRGFTGRVEALAALDGHAADAEAGGGVVIVGLSGSAGVGKTALAVHWAHRAAARFPDGQLFVDLRGFGPADQTVPADEAVRVMLDGLGVPPHRIPAGLDARAALYRSVTAGRRVLVLLDNARDAAHVRPLLPAAPGCLVLVTSRSNLAGLIAGAAAVPLPIDVLGHADARRLLAARLGEARVAGEPAAVERIIDRCGGLPLALAIAAARAGTDRPRSLDEVARTLAGAERRLDPFAGPDRTTDVRAVFSWSYERLRPPAARLFRLLGLHRGDDLSVAAAASLTATPARQVAANLTELAAVHLLGEVEPGRYGLHDLLRAFAHELVATDPEGPAGLRRLLDHYLHTAAAAAGHLDAFLRPLPLAPPAPGVTVGAFAGRDAAMAWFAAEYRVLMACVSQAAQSDDPDLTGHPAAIAHWLRAFQHRTGRWVDGLGVQRIAVTAARRHGDRLGEAAALDGVAWACAHFGDPDGARDAGLRAAAVYQDAGLLIAAANAYRNIAHAMSHAGRRTEAMEYARRQTDLCAEHGDAADEALSLNTYGNTLADLGRHHDALRPLGRALALQLSAGDTVGAAFTLDSLGLVQLRMVRLADAERYFRRSLALFERAGNRYSMVCPLTGLGDVFAARGDRGGARELYLRARRVCREFDGHYRAAALDDRLAEL